jgi:1-acyl-sn-glycerol-3-phosphate acyltransferase
MSTERSARELVSFLLRRPLVPPVAEPTGRHATGADFDTSFARREGVRKARAVALDAAIVPLVERIASPTVRGAEILDALEPPVIVVANHQSHLDTPLVLSILPPRLRHRTVVGAGADFFFDRRTKGYLSAGLLGAIPIERTRASRGSAQLALALVEDGWSLVLFPEGGRTPDGLEQELKAGAAQIAIKSGRPVVPMFIDGTYEIYGKQSKGIHPGTTTVIVGRPLAPVEGERPAVLQERIRQALEVLGAEAASDFYTARLEPGRVHFPAPDRGWIEAWNRQAHRFTAKEKGTWPRLFGSRPER